ncbi:hypothetical protein BD309DRAFT_967667 [Dichomitus squalens]|nr:hypothetical protein BD309DRAFT_967667 [Dichomitus squalens]
MTANTTTGGDIDSNDGLDGEGDSHGAPLGKAMCCWLYVHAAGHGVFRAHYTLRPPQTRLALGLSRPPDSHILLTTFIPIHLHDLACHVFLFAFAFIFCLFDSLSTLRYQLCLSIISANATNLQARDTSSPSGTSSPTPSARSSKHSSKPSTSSASTASSTGPSPPRSSWQTTPARSPSSPSPRTPPTR